MTTEQMAWGLAGVMATCLGAFIWREITRKDTLEARIEANRQAAETALEKARTDFMASLDKTAGRFTLTADALNTSVSALTESISDLNFTLAKEYVSQEQWREFKGEVNKALGQIREDCRDGCPYRGMAEQVHHNNRG